MHVMRCNRSKDEKWKQFLENENLASDFRTGIVQEKEMLGIDDER